MAKIYDSHGAVASHDEQDVIPVARRHIIMMSMLHEFAQEHKISVTCQKCGRPFIGNNNDSQPILSIACHCREFRYRQGDR